jgi:hypothetical protein
MLRPLQAGCRGLPDRVIFRESHHLATAEPFSKAGPDRTGCRESSNSLAKVQAESGWASCFWVGLKEARGWASEIPVSDFGAVPTRRGPSGFHPLRFQTGPKGCEE